MAELLPNWLQENCYPAQYDRLMLANVVCAEGVADVVGGSLLVATGGANLDLSVAQGGGWVEGDDDDRGMYSIYNDAPVTLTATAANPTNPRIDQVIARVYDSTYGEGADEWVLEMLDGTPTAGATLTNLNGAASLPDNSVTLAYILVPATFTGPFVNATHIKDARTEFTSCGQPVEPYVELVAAATTSIPNTGTATKVTLGTTVANDDEFFTVASSVVTILKAGRYDLNGYAALPSAATDAFFTIFKTNATTRYVALLKAQYGTMNTSEFTLAAGDTIELQAAQFGGSAQNTTHTTGAGTNISRLMIRKVG